MANGTRSIQHAAFPVFTPVCYVEQVFLHIINVVLVKRKNPVRSLTTPFTAEQVCNLCSPHIPHQGTVPATEKARSGCKNNVVLETQEKSRISRNKSLTLALPITSWTTLRLCHCAASGPLWAAGRPPLATSPCNPSAASPALLQH